MRTVAVIGAGIFGVTAAMSLRRRGDRVLLFDPGPLPHPLAESTDVSKVVRADYGADETYAEMGERAIDGWRRWNAAWGEAGRDVLFHETGVLAMSRAPMAPGGYEFESHALLSRRGHALQRLDGRTLQRRFPAWSDAYADGYYNPSGGWAESGRVVERLVEEARAAGVVVRDGVKAARLDESDSRVVGFRTENGETVRADAVVVASGSWTRSILPWLKDDFRTVGQPVFHLAPADTSSFESPRFVVYLADIVRTGWYGFPVAPGGIVKIANHGIGRTMHPESPERAVTTEEETAMRAFVQETFPGLGSAPLRSTRVCVYCDTHDEHFWIAPDPERAGLVVAAGGSGHAFKFAPLLGDWIADAVEGRVVPRFRWRRAHRATRGEEATRHRVD